MDVPKRDRNRPRMPAPETEDSFNFVGLLHPETLTCILHRIDFLSVAVYVVHAFVSPTSHDQMQSENASLE